MGLLKLPRIRHRRYRNMNIEPGLEPLIAQWICRAIMRSRWTAREALQRLDRSDLLPYIGISEATEDPDNMDEQEFWNLIKSHIGRGGGRRRKHGGTVYKNVEFFSRIMDLEQVEQEVLYFAVILGLTEHFKGFLQELFTFPHLESLASFVGDILGLPSHEVLRALNKNSTLVSARIINGGRIGARGEPLDVLEGLKMLMVQRYASEQELLDNTPIRRRLSYRHGMIALNDQEAEWIRCRSLSKGRAGDGAGSSRWQCIERRSWKD
jgi:hypothetical protein